VSHYRSIALLTRITPSTQPAAGSACAGTLGTFAGNVVNGAEQAGAAVVNGVEGAAHQVGSAIRNCVNDVENFVGGIF
jgi:hypothetical protein